jgi:hypothetical protein
MQEVRASLKEKADLFENSLADLEAAKKDAVLTALVGLLGELSAPPDSFFGERRPSAVKVTREQELQWIINRLRPK